MPNLRRLQSNRGYTLAELLIYMVVSSIAILIVMTLISKTTKSYTQQRFVSEAQSTGRDIASIIVRDLSNLGLKYCNNSSKVMVKYDKVFWKAPGTANDSAAFNYGHSTVNGDTLRFKKVITNASFVMTRIDSTVYWLAHDTLKRSCIAITGSSSATENGTFVIANNVDALQFRFSQNYVDWVPLIELGTADHYLNSIQAIEVLVLVRTKQKVSIKGNRIFNMGNFLWTAPANDLYNRRLYTGNVQVVNNVVP